VLEKKGKRAYAKATQILFTVLPDIVPEFVIDPPHRLNMVPKVLVIV
jgi:hypothetical protein